MFQMVRLLSERIIRMKKSLRIDSCPLTRIPLGLVHSIHALAIRYFTENSYSCLTDMLFQSNINYRWSTSVESSVLSWQQSLQVQTSMSWNTNKYKTIKKVITVNSLRNGGKLKNPQVCIYEASFCGVQSQIFIVRIK